MNEARTENLVSMQTCRVPVDEYAKLKRIEEAARRLLSLVEQKGLTRDHPENQALINAGDIICVNEGNLWLLQMALNS
jgi:hypothetical protein